MKEMLINSINVIKNIEGQFSVDDLEPKLWSEGHNEKFWVEFEKLSGSLNLEVNKLAIMIDINSSKKSTDQEIEPLCKNIEQISIALWSTFLLLSPNAGHTYCLNVAQSFQGIICSTKEFLMSLLHCSKRQEVLTKVGEVIERYDHIKMKISRNNVKAVCKALMEQRALVQDALTELNEAKDMCDKGLSDENWTPSELQLLHPSLGLIKTASAILKRISSALKAKGKPFDSQAVKEMDEILENCQRISPSVDDLAVPLYPSMSRQEVDEESKKLSQVLKEVLESLKNVSFVSEDDYNEWGKFLWNAVDHNVTKLDITLAGDLVQSLGLK